MSPRPQVAGQTSSCQGLWTLLLAGDTFPAHMPPSLPSTEPAQGALQGHATSHYKFPQHSRGTRPPCDAPDALPLASGSSDRPPGAQQALSTDRQECISLRPPGAPRPGRCGEEDAEAPRPRRNVGLFLTATKAFTLGSGRTKRAFQTSQGRRPRFGGCKSTWEGSAGRRSQRWGHGRPSFGLCRQKQGWRKGDRFQTYSADKIKGLGE